MSSPGTSPRRPAAISREEADQIAQRWVAASAPAGTELTPVVHEFDLGYLVWGRQSADQPPLFGAGRGIIDRETGELSVWPSLPVALVIEEFTRRRAASPPAPRTWDPAAQARRDLVRVATPARMTHLTVGDQVLISRSVQGDDPPNHHALVSAFLSELAVELRERGYERCSEAAALSDALHAEDARRALAGQRPITLDQARDELFRGASMVTYRVRERGDPVGGKSGPPCISCALLARHFGFEMRLPSEWAEHSDD